MALERRTVEQIGDGAGEIAALDQRVEDILDGDQQEAVVVVVGTSHHETLVVARPGDPVVGAEDKVIQVAGNVVVAVEGVKVVAGVVVATAFGVGGIGEGTALAAQGSPGSDDQRGKLAGDGVATAIENVDLALGIPVENIGLDDFLETA